MSVVVDTSAVFALLKADDANSEVARRLWLRSTSLRLVTHAYVVWSHYRCFVLAWAGRLSTIWSTDSCP